MTTVTLVTWLGCVSMIHHFEFSRFALAQSTIAEKKNTCSKMRRRKLLKSRRMVVSPLFSETETLFSHRDQVTREVIEAFHIAKRKDYCISQASITLSDCDMSSLENML